MLTEDGRDIEGGILMMGLGLGRGAFAGPVVDFFELALRATIVNCGNGKQNKTDLLYLSSHVGHRPDTRGNSWKRKKVSSFANSH